MFTFMVYKVNHLAGIETRGVYLLFIQIFNQLSCL